MNFSKLTSPGFYRITCATVVTCIRFLLTPFIIDAILAHEWHRACVLFAIAALSDLLDGFIARRYQQETVLGAYLDAAADKVLILSACLSLAAVDLISEWFLMVVLGRELTVLMGVLLLYCINGSVSIAPTFLGKLTMGGYMCVVLSIITSSYMQWQGVAMFPVLLSTVSFLSLSSLFQYIVMGCFSFKRISV